MSQDFGMAMPTAHAASRPHAPVRYLVVIESGGGMVARLYSDSRKLVIECDAATNEISTLTAGISPTVGALESEWDGPLQGYNLLERAGAEVYTLEL